MWPPCVGYYMSSGSHNIILGHYAVIKWRDFIVTTVLGLVLGMTS